MTPLIPRALLALPFLLAACSAAFPDEAADKVAAQKKAAEENWEAVGGEAAHVETAHLLVYTPKSFDKRLKDIAATLEKYYEQARKPLGYEKEAPWPGKLAVSVAASGPANEVRGRR